MDGSLEGRRVLVTGASSGIGAATARAVAAAGGHVALLARRAEPLQALAAELDGIAVPADVTDVAATRTAVDRAAAGLGGIEAIVNAAGVLRPGAIATTDPADWQLTFDVNVRGLLHATQAAIPHLRAAGGGDVVNVSSMSGRRLGTSEMAVYAASKAAVHALSEGLRRELADDRIRVAVLAPGFVRTGIFTGDDEVTDRLRGRAHEVGLAPAAVGDAVVRILEAPPEVVHLEVALVSLDQ
jgi:NADP-dependent 3-hydroxy acid dehydrogenase YdfG